MPTIATPDSDEVNRRLRALEDDEAPAHPQGMYQMPPEEMPQEVSFAVAMAGADPETANHIRDVLEKALDPETHKDPDKASKIWVGNDKRHSTLNGQNVTNGHAHVEHMQTAADMGLVSIRVSDVEAKAIVWLWDQRLACGKFSIITGNPGLGKSQITASLTAVVTTGGRWPVTRDQAPKGSVLILSAEDDPEDTIRPRLEAAGAALESVHLLQAVMAPSETSGSVRRGFNLSMDIPKLVVRMREIGDVRLVIIDPISAYFGNTDSHKNAEVRTLLLPLQQAAQEMGAAIIGVSHLTKSEGMDVLLRTQGSVGIVAAARAVFGVGKDKDDPGKRYFMPLKNNLATDMNGFSYHIEEYCLAGSDPLIRTSRVMWDNELVTKNADEVFTNPDKEQRSAVDEAEDFLRDALSLGWMRTLDLQAQARKAGISWISVKRAQTKLHIKPTRHGGLASGGGWGWEMPEQTENE